MPASRTYTLAGAADASTAPSVRVVEAVPTAPRMRTWDAIARALSLRPVADAEQDARTGPTLRITVVPGASARAPQDIPPSWTHVATDRRGTAWRTPQGWMWKAPGFWLALPTDGCSARVEWTLAPDAGHQRTVRAHAFRHALTMLLPRTGWMPLHGAGLCAPPGHPLDGTVLLLVGPSGCGKSTLTAGLLQRGWRCISDDLLALAPPDPSEAIAVRSLTRDVRLCPDAWVRLGFGTDAEAAPMDSLFGADANGQPKHALAPPAALEDGADAEADDGSLAPALAKTPACVLLPTIVSDARSRLRPAAQAAALPAMLSQMQPPALLTPAVAQAQLDRVAAVLRSGTAFHLDAGHDLYRDPGALAALLADAPDAVPA